jgi:dihydroxyacid dehydratase/phosphogluconate dehydratase
MTAVTADIALAAVRLREKKYTQAERDQAVTDKHAMADGSYPIYTASDVENAVNDWGRTGSSPAVKAHIIAMAKKVGATSSLPADWDASTAAVREAVVPALRRLRESLRPVASDYHLQDAAKAAGLLWADSKIHGSGDEDDANAIANAVKRVKARREAAPAGTPGASADSDW